MSRLTRIREWIWFHLALHLPKRLAYWTLIHQGARVIRSNDEVVSEVTYLTVLNRVEDS